MLRTFVGVLLASAVLRVGAVPTVGDRAPDFLLPDQNGKEHTLGDYQGKWVVLAFYPKSATPGCTVQNRGLSEHSEHFEKLGVSVLAVSTDSVDAQKKFCDKEGLRHTLLADADGKAATAYGVMTKLGVASRTTIVVAPDGRVAKVFENVDPAKGTEQVLEFLRKATALPEFSLSDTTGKHWKLSEIRSDRGVLILFVSQECPISRAYEERMNEIATEFGAKGFVVLGVNSNVTESDADMRDLASRLQFPVLKDKTSEVADLFRASRTPEVILLSPERKLLYRGAIDDQTEPGKVTKRYLKETLQALVAGKPVPQAETQSFGCTIKRKQKK